MLKRIVDQVFDIDVEHVIKKSKVEPETIIEIDSDSETVDENDSVESAELLDKIEKFIIEFLTNFTKEDFDPRDFRSADILKVQVKNKLVIMDRMPIPISKFIIEDWVKKSRYIQKEVRNKVYDDLVGVQVCDYMVIFEPFIRIEEPSQLDASVRFALKSVAFQPPAK